MKKERYISRKEQKKCKKVADAFVELYEIAEVVVVDVGRYGYVKLQYYYKPPRGFDGITTYTDADTMFKDLWREWLEIQLFTLSAGTSVAKMDYADMMKYLPKKKQQQLMDRKKEFARRAKIKLE
ncbi:MAG: hypothetical protein HFH68_15640 [Lachnospiraceae bacterium]|nr:hypothetical protein [Lachnospiraceae bacterium]